MVSSDSSNPVALANELATDFLDAPAFGDVRGPVFPRTRATQMAPLFSQRSHLSAPADQTHFLRKRAQRSHAARIGKAAIFRDNRVGLWAAPVK